MPSVLPYATVALDLDGTLLTTDKRVSPKSVKVLTQLKELGVNIILASGRSSELIEPFVDVLGFNCFIIGYNGAQCLSLKDNDGKRKLLFQDTVPNNRLREIFDYAKERNLLLNINADKEYVLETPGCRKTMERYSQMTGAKVHYITSYSSIECFSPIKCLFILENENECESIISHVRPLFPDIEVIKSRCGSKAGQQFYVEFLPKGIHKGTAIAKWCVINNCNIEDTLAFGDAENDIGMLSTVKMGICMKDSPAPLQAVAKKMTEFTNNEDGVASEIQFIFGLQE